MTHLIHAFISLTLLFLLSVFGGAVKTVEAREKQEAPSFQIEKNLSPSQPIEEFKQADRAVVPMKTGSSSDTYLAAEVSHVHIDQRRGVAALRLPIVVAPGVNNMTPDLRVSLDPDKKQGLGIDGVSTLQECGVGQLCLDGVRLVKRENSKGQDVYIPAVNPQSEIRQIRGEFSQILASGQTLHYQKIAGHKKGAATWKVARATDIFGNFIAYSYDDLTGALSGIQYGQKDAAPENLRSIMFQWQPGGAPFSQITSYIGQRKVRTYLFAHQKQGFVKSILNCGFDKGSKPVCVPPIQIEWISQNNTDQNLYMSKVTNSLGGVTQISYDFNQQMPRVRKVIEMDRGNVLNIETYAYENIHMRNGKFHGFSKVSRHSAGEKFIEVTEYGKGDLETIVQARSRYKAETKNGNDGVKGHLSQSIKYSYMALKGSDGALVLAQTKSQDNSNENPHSIRRTYDQKGRVKSEDDGSFKSEFVYLDEMEKGFISTVFANLIAQEEVQNLQTKDKMQRDWTYKIVDQRLIGSSVKTTLNKNWAEAEVRSQELDAYGNIIKLQTPQAVSIFSYEKAFATYPVEMSVQQGEIIDVARFRHDPAHGKVVWQKLINETVTDFDLDAFGRTVQSKSSYEVIENGAKRLNVVEKADWTMNAQKRVQQSKVVTISREGMPTVAERSVETYDGFGQVLSIEKEETEPKSARPAQKVNFTYSLEGVQRQTIDPKRGTQLLFLDRSGKILGQQQEGYGLTSYAYDDQGRLKTKSHNGREVRYTYDAQGRLLAKLLPDGQRTEFSYITETGSQIAKVNLPNGFILKYAYDAEGHVASKHVLVPLKNGGYYGFETGFSFKDGRLASVTYPDRSAVEYNYDEGSLAAVKWLKARKGSGAEDGDVISRYTYSTAASGAHLFSKTLANGLQERFRWDQTGKLSAIDLIKAAQTPQNNELTGLVSLKYGFDEKTGLLTNSRRMQASTREVLTQSFDYDYHPNGQLRAAHKTGVGAPLDYDFDSRVQPSPTHKDVSYKADPFGNIVATQAGNRRSEFKFDADNNLIHSVSSGDGEDVVLRYAYDHTGQRIMKANENGDVTYFISPFYEFTILKDGRMQETRHVWDQQGRMASFTTEVKDADLAVIFPGKSTHATEYFSQFFADFQAVISDYRTYFALVAFGLFVYVAMPRGQKKSGASFQSISNLASSKNAVSLLVLISFLCLNITPTAQAVFINKNENLKLDQVKYYHADIRGSVYAVTNDQGRRTASFSYAPYGQPEKGRLWAGRDYVEPTFASHDMDPETGLYYMGARYYDPSIRRFLSPDPAYTRKDPYEYANSNPITFIDPDGRAGEDAPRSSWQRFKTWSGIENWRCCGARNKQTIPEEWGGPPTDEEKAEFDRYHRNSGVNGWSRFGGYLQSLLIAPVLAYMFPSSATVDDVVIAPGFGIDFLNSAITVTIFSAFGKAYTAVEALRWEEQMESGEITPADGYRMLMKRMVYKIGGQVPLFVASVYFKRFMSGFPLLEMDDAANDLAYLVAQYTLMSIFGNLYLLPYYYGSKPWSSDGDATPEFRQMVADSTGVSGMLMKTGLFYRDFNKRRAFWSPERGEIFRSDFGWYSLYVAQMYGWYHLGSAGYYSGYAIFGGIASNTADGFDWDQFKVKWIKNIIGLELSPASSPLALINSKTRWSLTCIREVSPLSPEEGRFLKFCLGKTGGLRIGKYTDSAYASDYTIVKWLIKEGRRSGNIEIVEEELEQPVPGRQDVEMSVINISISTERDEEDAVVIEVPPREISRSSVP